MPWSWSWDRWPNRHRWHRPSSSIKIGSLSSLTEININWLVNQLLWNCSETALKKVHSRGVSPEAQTLTNEVETTVLQHTLTHVYPCWYHLHEKIKKYLFFLFFAIYKIVLNIFKSKRSCFRLWKKVHSRGVSPEVQTLTNEVETTVLQHTLTHVYQCWFHLHKKRKKYVFFLFFAIYKIVLNTFKSKRSCFRLKESIQRAVPSIWWPTSSLPSSSASSCTFCRMLQQLLSSPLGMCCPSQWKSSYSALSIAKIRN